MQPAEPSAEPQHSRVLSPVVGGPMQCNPRASAITIGVLNPLKMASGSLADSLLTRWTESPLTFTTRWYACSSSHLLLWVGDPCVGLRFHAPRGRSFAAKISLWLLNCHLKVQGRALSASLPFLPFYAFFPCKFLVIIF